MDIILIAGLWLKSAVWDDVAAELARHGHRPIPLRLPGADDASASATLDDQVTAAVAAVDTADEPVVVGHSAACSLAWIAADRRPEAIGRVVMVGGVPAGDGGTYADFFDTVDGVVPFPGWGPFEGPDSADLDEATKARVADEAVPVPAGVTKGIVRLTDGRRFDVPVTLVCPEYTPEQAKAWIDAGDVAELPSARDVSYVDIDSGHWPMFSRPADLAHVLHDVATAR